MKIRITNSGGLAGQEEIELASLDTQILSATNAQQIKQKVDAIFSQSEEDRVIGADLMQFRIEVEDDRGERKETIVMDEGEAASPIQQLLTVISNL